MISTRSPASSAPILVPSMAALYCYFPSKCGKQGQSAATASSGHMVAALRSGSHKRLDFVTKHACLLVDQVQSSTQLIACHSHLLFDERVTAVDGARASQSPLDSQKRAASDTWTPDGPTTKGPTGRTSTACPSRGTDGKPPPAVQPCDLLHG